MKYTLSRMSVFWVIGVFIGANNPITADMEGLWEFDEHQGIIAASSIGEHYGTIKGHLQRKTHEGFGQALLFGGTESIILPDCDVEGLSTEEYSLGLWVKIDSFGDGVQNLIVKNDCWKLQIDGRTQTPLFQCRCREGNCQIQCNKALPKGQWHHLAVTYDPASIMTFYIDGRFTTSVPTKGPIQFTLSDIVIGVDENDAQRGLMGSVDEIAVFSHALNADEVTQLCQKGGRSFIPSRCFPPELVVGLSFYRQACKLTDRKEHQQAVQFLEELVTSSKNDLNKLGCTYWLAHLTLENLYLDNLLLLAQNKELLGVPQEELIAIHYKIVKEGFHLLFFPVIRRATAFLLENGCFDKLQNLVAFYLNDKNKARSLQILIVYLYYDYQNSNDWKTFEQLLDICMTQVPTPYQWAVFFGVRIEPDDPWSDQLCNYLREKCCPQLTKAAFHAEYTYDNKQYDQAAEQYRLILSLCQNDEEKCQFGFRLCECLYFSGDPQALESLDHFITDYPQHCPEPVKNAKIMKGKILVQQGFMDQAVDLFQAFIAEYPQAQEIPDIQFTLGYCYMLEGNNALAKKTFQDLVAAFPTSEQRKQAEKCLSLLSSAVIQ